MDLISRQAASEAIDTALRKTFVDYVGVGKKILSDVPSAQKKGHWVQRINASAFGFPLSIYFCSECDSSAKNAFSDDMLPNFCPNCGADMRESSD
jgi:hypothetical protein